MFVENLIPDIELPDEPLDEGAFPRAVNYFVVQPDQPDLPNNSTKIRDVQISVTKQYDNNGFVDDKGYLVKIGDDGKPTPEGDATLFTALAVISLATGNYKPDEWETQHAKTTITGFLNVLLEKSWGKTDFVLKGEIAKGDHPIRHPKVLEWDKSGRNSCPNCSAEVRTLPQTLLTKWIKYLSEHRWMLLTNWSGTELEEVTYNSGTLEKQNQRLTVEGFMLWPHELYALKDCALSLSVSQSIPIPYIDSVLALQDVLEKGFPDFVMKLSDSFVEALDTILGYLNYSDTFDIELIPGWRRSAVKGRYSVGIDANQKKLILQSFEAAFKGLFLNNAAMFRDILKLKLEFSTTITKFIEQILGLFRPELKHFPVLD
ncbi:hypothetical protein N7540_000443 [Penicillium herquei]|nr:hypothetical protein N7540_000443 [Penicillium herquei]